LLQADSLLIPMETDLLSRKFYVTSNFTCPLQISYFQTIIPFLPLTLFETYLLPVPGESESWELWLRL